MNRSLVVLLLSVFVPLGHADNVVGAWSPPAPWPLIAIHSVLTPDGRVLTYGTDGVGTQTGFFIYDVWDPSAGPAAGHVTLPNTTGTDIFCSSQLVLPQSGNIFLAGGDTFVNGSTTSIGNNNTNVFTPGSNALARGNNMKRARWYSSTTTLLNGEIYIQGGSGGSDRPEVRDINGAFRLLSGANTSPYNWNYPRNFVASGGRVFGFDTTGKMYYVNPTSSGNITAAGQLPGSSSRTMSAVMFRPGRILKMGGATSAAYVIDINGPTPVVTSTQSMSSKRQWVSATVLADGRVLATGGSAVDNQLTGVNNTAEIWDPDTGLWTLGHGRDKRAPVSLGCAAITRCARPYPRRRRPWAAHQSECRNLHAALSSRSDGSTDAETQHRARAGHDPGRPGFFGWIFEREQHQPRHHGQNGLGDAQREHGARFR